MLYVQALWLALAVGGVMALSIHLQKRKQAEIRRLLSAAELEFRRIRVESDHPRFRLSGRSAQVLKRLEHAAGQDASQVPEDISIHYHVRNPHGEYFFIIIRSDEPPFIKHMSHQAAKAVLKDRYLAPPEHDV